MKYYILALLLIPLSLLAQSEHTALLDGTTAYKKGDFSTAEQHFRKAIEKNDQSLKGNFNLGNSLYKRKKYDEAATFFQNAASNTEDKLEKAKVLYNLGNTRLEQAKGKMEQQGQAAPTMGKESQEQLEKAIEAYKNSLRNNSKDYDAKNNLALAYKLLRQQQQQQQQKQNKDQNKDENKDNDKKDQNKPNDNKDEDKPIDNENNNAEPKKLNKDEVDRLLEIIDQEDQKVQEKLMKRKRAQTKKPEKDW